MNGSKELYQDIKDRVEAAGRNRNHIKILPAAMIIVGDSVEDAQSKRLKLVRAHNLIPHIDTC